MGDRFLEKKISIKFCVKLGRDAGGTCTMPSKYYGGEATKMSCVFQWHIQFKEGHESMKMMKELVVKDVREWMKILKKMPDLVHSDSQPGLLCRKTESVT
jgi:hypothetical protein